MFIQAYTLTEDSEEEEKDQFYADLERMLAYMKKDDMVIAMGDMNGRAGREMWSVE